MRKILFAFLFAFICPWLVAQAITNDSVIKMAKAGLSDDVIVSTINSAAGNFDTSANGLIALKTAGVSDKVVAAIVVKGSGVAPAAAAPPAAPPPPPAAAPQGPPPPPFHSMDGKIRVYVTDHPISESTSIAQSSGNRHGDASAAVSHSQQGDDPRTVEIQADIQKLCPKNVIASNNPDRSDYVLVFRRRGGSRSSMFAMGGLTGLALSAGMKVDGASLFDNTGDMVYATKQNSVEKSIKDICDHIPGAGAPPSAPDAPPAAPMAPVPPPPAPPAQ
jgi:hypothetical protein